MLPPDQRREIEQAKFTYSPFRKGLWKTNKNNWISSRKTNKEIEEHGKQLVIYDNEKESSTHSREKEIFEELAKKRKEEIQDLSKQIDFNNLICHYKHNTALKTFIGFKGPLGFYRNIMEDYLALEKTKEEQKEFKSKINERVIGKKKSEDQKSTIDNIKTLYKSWKKVIKLFNNYSQIASEAKYKAK